MMWIKNDSLDADVVVVGAGPAGCAAAYDLGAKGLRVLLLDRTEFPRKKICAGGLTIKAVRALRYSIDPVVQRIAHSLSVTCRMRHPKRLASPDPICYMVERSAFDFHCLQKTRSAGADFRQVKQIHQIMESERTVSLFSDRGVIRTRFVIGADGVHSQVRKLTGRFAGLHAGIAVEGIIDKIPPGKLGMGFDFSRVSGGYGWVFPKKDHINLGLYTQKAGERITRQDLANYASRRIGDVMPVRVSGYHLGMGGWRYRPGRGRILLVGDAAGFVDPLLGEGLYHAICSGQYAAAAIGAALDTGCDACISYARRLMPIQRELSFSTIASIFFYRLPRIGHLLLTSPIAGNPLVKGFSRGMPLQDIFCKGYRFWLGMPVSHSQTVDRF